MFKPVDLIKSSLIVFDFCKQSWGISDTKLASIIEQYDLGNLFIKHFEWFNGMGKQGVLNAFEEYIKEKGGSIYDS